MIVSHSPQRLQAAYEKARAALFHLRLPAGHWEGELSTSALSTATAIMALALVQKQLGGDRFTPLVLGGLRWLAEHQNDDGGWGDTVRSFSNISTTMLCRSAIHLTGATQSHAQPLERAERWLNERYGSSPQELAEAVRARYGKDRTFATPILTTCALAGLVDWSEVPPLPFELACLPQSWFRFLRLHVVSYALPALIGIGQAIHHHRPTWNPLTWGIRRLARSPSMRVLQAIQPTSGGFLEATPLTSFVTLSLASIGLSDHPVARLGIEFLQRSARPDGSWAIDSNLATWVTTLSINALASANDLEALEDKERLRDWLVGQQYRVRHPYTGADPGGWAWTDLPGGVPDADDTPGALLALGHLKKHVPVDADVFRAGERWLLGLQNRDGGWPTFCRGWGHLPFDRSGADLTAHVLRALPAEHASAHRQGLAYLAKQQRADGSWLPLWFGNQHVAEDENPTYGTARVLAAYRQLAPDAAAAQRGRAWLRAAQNVDGGWGGAAGSPSSIEETALALEALGSDERGLAWLIEQVEHGKLDEPTPIGFYFAKLWYYERLYPIIFAVAALGQAR